MIKDRLLSLYPHKPFTIISGMQEKIEILLDAFEPEELLDLSTYSDTSNPVIPSLLRIRDEHDSPAANSEPNQRFNPNPSVPKENFRFKRSKIFFAADQGFEPQ